METKNLLNKKITQWLLLVAMLLGCSASAWATDYYYRGSDNSFGATKMTASDDGYYCYIQSSNKNNQFKIATSTTGWDYNCSKVSKGFNGTNVQNIGDYGEDNCYCWQTGTYYIILYYPNTSKNSSNDPKICASTSLPNDNCYVKSDMTVESKGTKYVGDKISSSESWYNFQVGQASWYSSDVLVGTANTSGNYSTYTAEYYADGDGSNKKVHANIQNHLFTKAGTWYAWGRAKGEKANSYSYTKGTDWGNSTSATLSTSSQIYWTVNAVPAPKSCSIEVTNAASGTGTQADPYIVISGDDYTVTVTATKADGFTGSGYAFNINTTDSKTGDGTTASYSKDYTAGLAGSSEEYTGYAWHYNGSTTYYSSEYATSSKIYVSVKSACTPPTSVTTDAASMTGATSATVGGSYTGGDTTPDEVGVIWTNGKSGTEKFSSVTNPFSKEITGLTAGASYSYKAYVKACGSSTPIEGSVVDFTVTCTATKPTVITVAASNITSTGATIGCDVTSAGIKEDCSAQEIAARGIEWVSGQGVTPGAKVSIGSGTGSATKAITGLTPGETYVYRAYATNASGTSYSENAQFTTTCPAPTVTTSQTQEHLTKTTVTLSGSYSGGTNVTEVGIEIDGTKYPAANLESPFTVDITGLTENTTYNYKAYTTYKCGTEYGTQYSFTTKTGRCYDGTEYLYFDVSASWFGNDGAVPYVSFDGGSTYTDATNVSGKIYKILVPEGCYTSFKVQRHVGGYIGDEGTISDVASSGTKNEIVTGDWGSKAYSWSTFAGCGTAANFALGGYLNETDVDTYSDTWKLDKISDNQYSKAFTFTAVHNNSQYLWIIGDDNNKWGVSSDTPIELGGSQDLQFKITDGKVQAPCTVGQEYLVTFNVDAANCQASVTWASGCTQPQATDFSMDPTSKEYTGGVLGTEVTYTHGSVSSVTYEPANPTNVGEYKVFATVTKQDGYCAGTVELSDKFTITKKAPAVSDFDITGLEQSYTGFPVNVTVKPKTGITGMGSVTVKYSPAEHKVPGNYAVTFSVAAGSNYTASTSDFSAGTLVISKANQTTPVVVGDLTGTPCGTGDYTLTASGGNGTGEYSFEYVVGGSGEATISGNTLSVTKTGTVIVRAKRAADSNYNESAYGANKTLTILTPPSAGFAISAGTATPEITTNAGTVSTTLTSIAANVSDAPYKYWYCTNNPADDNVKPTFSATNVLNPTVTFHKEGVYKFKMKAGCSSETAVESAELTVTVSGKIYIKGPIHDSGCWPDYNTTAWESSNGVYTSGSFAAYKNCQHGPSEFVLSRDKNDNDDKSLNKVATMNPDGDTPGWAFSTRQGDTGNYNCTLDYNEGDNLIITVTHEYDKIWKMRITMDCTTPESKVIQISSATVCSGNVVNVTVKASQNGYIYNVYDGSTFVATATGTGSDLNMAVTPTGITTYTVKAKQMEACEEIPMANTVAITTYKTSPAIVPSTGVTQYLPVTVKGTAESEWSITTNPSSKGYLSAESGEEVIFKAPYNATPYVVKDTHTDCTVTIPVAQDEESCSNN